MAAGFVSGLVAQTWFRPGQHTAAGDVLPFIRNSLSAEAFELWNHQLTAAGGISAEIVRVFDLIFIHTAALFGLGPHIAQRLYYTALAVFAALAVTHMVPAVVSSVAPLADDSRRSPSTALLAGAGLAGVLAVLNPYWMVLIPNPIFLAVIGCGALSTAAVWRAASGRPPRLSRLALGALPLTILGTNPPLIAVWVVWSALSTLLAYHTLRPAGAGRRRFASFLLKASALTGAVNLFWIVPLLLTLISPTTSVAAQVSPEAWSWSHAQNTLPNVAGLNAFWGWAYAEVYVPYATRLDEVWWSPLRFALPLAALVALGYTLFQRHSRPLRRLGASLGVITAVTVVVAKGLHPPFVALNSFLYDHIPGMWLLREPMSKVGWIILFCYLLLIVSALSHYLTTARTPTSDSPSAPAVPPTRTLPILAALATLVLGSALAYVHPLYTGEAVPADRATIPGAYVTLPSELADLATAVDAQTKGRVLALPHSTFYQMGHTWGYYGVDQVLTQAFTSPTISLSTGGYFGQSPVFVALAQDVENKLLTGDEAAARRLLARLGVDTVVIRHDYDPGVSQSGLADPVALDDALASFGLEPTYRSSLATVYSLPAPPPFAAASPDETVSLAAASPSDWATAAALFDTDMVLLHPDSLADSGAEASAAVIVGSNAVALPAGTQALALSDPGRLPLTLTPDGRLSLATRLQLADELLPLADPVTAPGVQGPILAARVADPPASYAFAVDGATSFLAPSDAPVELFVTDPAATSLRFFARQACSPGQDSCLRVSLPTSPLPSSTDALLVTVSVNADLPSLELCLRLAEDSACHHTASLERSSTGLEPSSVVLLKEHFTSEGRRPALSLRSSEPVAATDLVLTATPLVSAGEASVALPDHLDLPRPSAAGTVARFTLPSANASQPLTAADFSDLEDCDRSDASDPGLAFSGSGTELRLKAAAHSACVWANLGTPSAPALRVSFDHHTLSGRPARVCLWQTALSRCAPSPSVSDTADRFDEVITFETSQGEIRLFVYADAPPSNLDLTTEVVYRDITVTPLPQILASALTAPPSSDEAATPTFSVVFADSFPEAVLLTDLPAGTLLTFSESFSPDLVLSVDGRAVAAEHFEVEGWANGWLLAEDLSSGSRLTISHTLEVYSTAALLVSLLTVLLSVLALSFPAAPVTARSRP